MSDFVELKMRCCISEDDVLTIGQQLIDGQLYITLDGHAGEQYINLSRGQVEQFVIHLNTVLGLPSL